MINRRTLLLTGSCVALPLLIMAWAGLWHIIYGIDAYAIDLDQVLADTSWLHPLGCDALGRDVLMRLAGGIELSLMVGIVVIVSGGTLGIGIGMIAAWYGGWIDAMLMRLADIVLSFPGILLAIAMAAMLGPAIENLILALVAVGWVGFARLSRVQALSLKHAPFIEAARANSAGITFITTRHLLPNIAAPLLVEASFGLAAVIIGEAGLSFLGVGVQPPDTSLGTMIREGTHMMLVVPNLVIWPGMVLFALVMAVNLLGDALRDTLDVKHVEKH